MPSTPGPWRIHTFTPKGWSTETTTILGPDDVAIVGGVHWGSADGSVGQANARLICAAPEMYRALQAVAHFWGHDPLAFGDEATVTSLAGQFGKVADLARIAIAKAEGRE